MRIIRLEDITPVVTPAAAVRALRAGLEAMAAGEVTLPDPMQLLLHDNVGSLAGDCHAKAAQWKGRPNFIIKVATGFYNNPSRGLPTNDSRVLVFSSETGRLVALI